MGCWVWKALRTYLLYNAGILEKAQKQRAKTYYVDYQADTKMKDG
jgi:hypothetical protein